VAWVSPTGFNDHGDWHDEANAYDGNIGTWAEEWSEGQFLDLTLPAISCDKIRIYCEKYEGSAPFVYIDVYYDVGWHAVFEGVIAANEWVEKGIVAGTQSVSKARITTTPWHYLNLYEFEFWEVPPMIYYHGLKVQGEGELALCDVDNNPLRIRKGDTTYGIELVATDDPNASSVRIKTGAGIKAIRKYT